MKKYGAIIARFQTMYLHDGHRYLIDTVNNLHRDNIIILLGVSKNINSRNILPYEMRKEIVLESYPNAIILPLNDIGNDVEWSNEVDNLLKDYDVCLYGSRDSFIPYYTGKLDVYEVPPVHNISATEIREQLRQNPPKSTDYRGGYIVGSVETLERTKLKYRIKYSYYDEYYYIDVTTDTIFVSNETEIIKHFDSLAKDDEISNSNIYYKNSFLLDGVICIEYFLEIN